MFEASLLEPAGRGRRGWATIASFTAQAVVVGLLVLVPLLYTQALPHLQALGTLSHHRSAGRLRLARRNTASSSAFPPPSSATESSVNPAPFQAV